MTDQQQDKPNDPTDYCTLHNKKMKKRQGKAFEYYDHRGKGFVKDDKMTYDDKGNWYWCSGKGWKLSFYQ